MNDEKEGAFVIPEELPKCRKIGKEEFVRRMMSDAHRRILNIKEEQRQAKRIITEYRSDNIRKAKHKLHMKDRRRA